MVNLTFSPTATRAGTDASETCPADHTGVVAGVLSGVLGAALIGLLIALICALKNRKALQRDLVSTQSQRDTAYEQNTNEKAQLQKQLEQLEQQQLQQQRQHQNQHAAVFASPPYQASPQQYSNNPGQYHSSALAAPTQHRPRPQEMEAHRGYSELSDEAVQISVQPK